MWISGCRLELECDRDTSAKKDGRKKVDKKNKLFGTTFFFNDKSINNKSDKMDFADVNDA